MALSTKLELRQGQQLVMTPQLQQAIRLLQLSNIELMQYVETELERNPLLEQDESTENATRSETENGEFTKPEEPAAQPAQEENWLDLGKPVADVESTYDTDYDNVYPDAAPAEAGSGGGGGDNASGWANLRQRSSGSDDDVNLEAFVANDVSLRQHLSEQLPLVLKEPAERLIGQYLIDMVDDAGYLPADLDCARREARRAARADRQRAGEPAIARPAGRVRALAGRNASRCSSRNRTATIP